MRGGAFSNIHPPPLEVFFQLKITRELFHLYTSRNRLASCSQHIQFFPLHNFPSIALVFLVATIDPKL